MELVQAYRIDQTREMAESFTTAIALIQPKHLPFRCQQRTPLDFPPCPVSNNLQNKLSNNWKILKAKHTFAIKNSDQLFSTK
jgi:hypothetical protein